MLICCYKNDLFAFEADLNDVELNDNNRQESDNRQVNEVSI